MEWIDKLTGKNKMEAAPALRTEEYLELGQMNLQEVYEHLHGLPFAGEKERNWIADPAHVDAAQVQRFKDGGEYFFLGDNGSYGYTLQWNAEKGGFDKETVHFNAAMGAITTWGSKRGIHPRRIVFTQ